MSAEQKSYSFGADKSREAEGTKDEAVKVQIEARLESAMLDLIRREKKEFRGSASQRLTIRKLTVFVTNEDMTLFELEMSIALDLTTD